MKRLKENKYFDLFILVIIAMVVFKVVDNYKYFFSFMKKLYLIISPFIIAIICAYVLSPLVNLFKTRLKFNKITAILCTYIFLGIIIFLMLFFTIPSLIDSAINMTSQVPEYLSKIQKYSNNIYYNQNLKQIINSEEIYNKIDHILTAAGNQAVVLLQNSLSSILSLTGNIVRYIFGFLMSIYVLIEKEKLLLNAEILLYMIFKERNGTIIINLIKTYNKMIGRYIGIKALDSIIIGLIAFVALYIIKIPYAVWIACVVAVTNMIPYFGPLIGEIFGAAITLFVSPFQALVVFCILLLIQQFDAWYLDPKLIGKKVGVSPFAVIFAVIVGGGLFGPVGMLLASPTMATINIYYSRMISNFKNKNTQLFKK